MTDLTDLNEVIEGLKELREYADSEIHQIVSPDNWSVYSRLRDLIDKTDNKALALLKAQEPRVLAEGEVLHSTGKPIWFESRGMYLSKKGFWILPFEVDPELHIRFVQSVAGGKITLSLIDYGKLWRCWNVRPTEQQMRETPWEGEDDG